MVEASRRIIIKASLPSFFQILFSAKQTLAAAMKASANYGYGQSSCLLNWDALIDRVAKLAKKQHSQTWNQQQYVSDVVSYSQSLCLTDPVLGKAFKQTAFPVFGRPSIVEFVQLVFARWDKTSMHVSNDHATLTVRVFASKSCNGNVDVQANLVEPNNMLITFDVVNSEEINQVHPFAGADNFDYPFPVSIAMQNSVTGTVTGSASIAAQLNGCTVKGPDPGSNYSATASISVQ